MRMKISVWAIVFLFLFAYLLLLLREDVAQNKTLKNEKDFLSSKIMEISESNIILEKNIRFAAGKTFVEKSARENLNFVKKGETTFKVCQ